MGTGTRDRRVRIYTYSDGDAETTGIVQSTYTFRAERWARMEAPSGREWMVAEAAKHSIDATFTFSDEVVLNHNDLFKYDGVYYEVRAIMPRRPTMEQHVFTEMVDVSQAGYLIVEPTPPS